jgi:hypothetical protein
VPHHLFQSSLQTYFEHFGAVHHIKMPTISVDKSRLCKSLGKEYTDKEFDELCFEFGIELDDTVTEENGDITWKSGLS